MNRSFGVLSETSVHLSVDFLSVILRSKRRKYQITIGQDLSKTRNIAYSWSVCAHPNNIGRGIPAGTAFDYGAGGVGEVDAIGGVPWGKLDRPLCHRRHWHLARTARSRRILEAWPRVPGSEGTCNKINKPLNYIYLVPSWFIIYYSI